MDDPELSAEEKELAKWWPAFRYRSDGEGGVEKRIFQHPDEVPEAAGWVDSPARVDQAPEKPKPAPAAPDGDAAGIQPPYEAHKFPVLRSELKRRTGKGPKVGTRKGKLAAMLEATDA